MRTEKIKEAYRAMSASIQETGTITIDLRDIHSLAAAIRHGITTPELLGDQIDGCEVIDDCLVVEPSKWTADDGNAAIDIEAETASDACQEYVDSGDWGDRNETTWVRVSAWLTGIDADGEIVHVGKESRTITLDAEEPECTHDGGHDWQAPLNIVGGCKENPGVWGHGGGVRIHECCMHCGCEKVTDTWAQNPSNGEQGLTAVEYTPGKYTSDLSPAE